MKTSTIVKLAAAAGTAAAAGATAGVVVAARRWAAADDPDAGTRLTVPEGRDVRIPTADDGQIAATVAGGADADGRTFVLVHGWTNDRRIWAPVARLLVDRGHCVVLYDQRAHGASRAGNDGLSIEAIGADMRAVVEHLDLRSVVVAGHSMGGMAAQSFATQFPEVLAERVSALALVSTACGDLAAPGLVGLLAPRVLGSKLSSRFLSNSRIGAVFVRNTLGRKATITNLRAMADTFVATEPATRAGFYRAMAGMDLSEKLAAVDHRVLVVSGTRDQLVEPSNTRRLADVIKGARFESIEDAGHMLPLEVPDVLADLLEDLASESQETIGVAASA